MKKICFKIPRIAILENVICIEKKLETKLQYFDIYFHNKNIFNVYRSISDWNRNPNIVA